ncbi:PAS domain-containing protein [Oceanisphaera psychrotolerans]|uniref:PAS fold-4 domain-containing protein n=1 Tax=Oceanisphaera psychrotolerans TaxID=1414654 RepID=A0A1J4QCQ4_9GAMM|nr:PAS domain-containing protein [Oceanisphaera psychrotolerans]OIN08053.1 hypothetical protein BFR47_15670 [Oceanisphaera psychrotolerans]
MTMVIQALAANPESLCMVTLDHVESGIMLLDGERRVRFWNQWLVRYTGIAADTACGQRLEQLFDEPLPAVVLSAIGDACEHRLSRLLSHQLHAQLLPLHSHTVSGARTPVYHSMMLRPLDDHQGLTLVQLHDTTNAVRRERHLRDKEQALRKVHQTLSEEKKVYRYGTENHQCPGGGDRHSWTYRQHQSQLRAANRRQ